MSEKKITSPLDVGDPDMGQHLASARLRVGLTQAKIANRIGVSRQHISKIESGLTSPTVRVLKEYLRNCGTDLAEFFYGPLPTDQTPHQREYHRKLQAVLRHPPLSQAVTKVLDSFVASIEAEASRIIQPVHVRVRRARARDLLAIKKRKKHD